MSKLNIVEYATMLTASGGKQVQVPLEPPLATQEVDFTSGATTSNAFNGATELVRICADATCGVLFGINPTAAATDGRVPADEPEYRGVPRGQSFKVSAISRS